MKSKILVADDNEAIRDIVFTALDKSDAIIESIGNGESAFNFLSEFNADLVLVKSDLSGLSGPQLSEKIKRSQKYYTSKVILLVSESQDFTDKQYVESMADDLVFKPFKSKEIYNKIKKALGNRLKEAMEEVEIDWEEEDDQYLDEDTDTSSETDFEDEYELEEEDLALDPGQKAKEMEMVLMGTPQNGNDEIDLEDIELEEDEFEEEFEKDKKLTEAMIDVELAVNPPQIPSEDVELTYFLASGGSGSSNENEGHEEEEEHDSDSIIEQLDSGVDLPTLKKNTFFNVYIETVRSSQDLKEVFEKILYLDSGMKKREIIHLTESVSNAILTVISDITPEAVRNIIKRELIK
ncbi:MAG: response regulator [Nitrospinales bacterium]